VNAYECSILISAVTVKIEDRLTNLLRGEPHREPLFVRQTAEGMHACYQNAVSLLADSRLLASRQRYARALSLVVLAWEDLSKVPALYGMAFSIPGRPSWKSFWTQFRQHRIKQERMARYGSLLMQAGHPPYNVAMTPAIVASLDELKQSGFYVDCFDGRFRIPDVLAADAIDVLDYLYAGTEERADSFAQFHATCEASEIFLHEGLDSAKHMQQSSTGRRADISGEHQTEGVPYALSEAELAGRIRSLAGNYSSHPIGTPSVPNYAEFSVACGRMLDGHPSDMVAGALRAELHIYEDRMKATELPTSAYRATLMYKLLNSYLRQADLSLRDRVMGKLPTERALGNS
jgi:AbiV family abortive infection protein